MARKVSTKKKPPREIHQLNERWKIESTAFDRRVLLIIYGLIKRGVIRNMDFPISTGKEANVFRATTPTGKFVAVKIYRVETTRFFNKQEYIIGDPRFERIKKDLKNLAYLFAKKEFRNLMICAKAGVISPMPIICKDNVLVMDFLGEGGLPYSKLSQVPTRETDLEEILEQIRLMYRHGLVHSDLSPYNILAGDKLYLIDFAQGVIEGHPRFEQFLERDVENLLRYFKSDKDPKKVLEWIRETSK